MPFILVYLFKLSVSLSVVYLFYQFLLRRLTFYNWNRFYLFCYTAISFLIPFINITPVLERNDIADNQVIRFIPAVGNINNKLTGGLPGGTGISSWTYWDWLLFFVLSGIAVMLIRLIVQLMSFKKIISQAQLVSDNKIKLYQVNQTIIPFSFGNSIFINQQLHSDEELTEIMRHEFVHVKQKHTADIIWAELLCILNWYNPFVWMIRKAIRQNLEFIADSKVLQSGIDRKQYQYLLLKVIGNNHFSIASQFNFSSLKKRIAMMNKMKSAGVHLLKFIFILPLIAILILSFRNRMNTIVAKNEKTVFSLSGIVYDYKTELPLAGVLMIEPVTGIQTKTDSKGFYEIEVPITETEKQKIRIKFTKKGYEDNDRLMEIEWKAGANWSGVGFFSLLANANDGDDINHAFFCTSKDEQGNIMMNPGYAFVKNKFETYFKQKKYDENAAELKIVTLEDLHIEQLGIVNGDTLPINHKGYMINVKNEKGKDIVIVMDKYGNTVKEVPLSKWNKEREYYESKYGKGVAEAIERAVKQSMGAVEVQGHFESDKIIMHLRTDMFTRKDIDSIIVTADTVSWSAKEKKFSFKGTASLEDKESHVNASGSFISFREAQNYVLLNGKELAMNEDYTSYTKATYLVVNLGKKQATEKYGDKGKNGAIEIFSQN